MRLPDDWDCPSIERCQCGSICEAREAMEDDEFSSFPGEFSTGGES